MSLTKDSSNFLSESNIQVGSYLASTDAPMYSLNNEVKGVYSVYDSIIEVENELNAILKNAKIPDASKAGIKTDLINTVTDSQVASPSDKRMYLNWGLDINFSSGVQDTVKHIRSGSTRHLKKNSHPVVKFYSGDKDNTGFIERAYESIAKIQNRIIDERI